MNALFLTLVVSLMTIGPVSAQVITDPVADFLSLPIDDRYGEASSVTRIDKVSIDLDLDGVPELLVGHHKMWLGDNNGVYFAIYKEASSGTYRRITQPNEDVRIVFNGGLPQFVFVGHVDEIGDTGLLICNPPLGDGALKMQRIDSVLFVSVSGGAAKVRNLSGLDLTNDVDKAFYKKYFGHEGKQGGFISKSLTVESLKQLGYTLPDWSKQQPLPAQKLPQAINSTVDPSSILTPSINSSTQTQVEVDTQSIEKVKAAENLHVSSSSSSIWWVVVFFGSILLLWFLFRK
jgi:hypothetical protein